METMNFKKFFEGYKNYHSFVNLLNLCKEVSDYIYNNDIQYNNNFESFVETKNGYEIIFNKYDKKNYTIDIKKEKIFDDNGNEQILDSVYEDIENLYNIIKNYDILINIKQIDEKMKTFNEIIEKDDLKSFDRVIKETYSFEEELKDKLSEKYSSLKREILKLLDKTLNSDVTKLQDYINDYIEPDSEEILDGFVEDADIFDIYLKHQNDIDQILLDNDYYEDPPGVESLYDYVIDGTFDAVVYCMEQIKEDLYGE